jgi:type IV pilus assembly protein PilP
MIKINQNNKNALILFSLFFLLCSLTGCDKLKSVFKDKNEQNNSVKQPAALNVQKRLSTINNQLQPKMSSVKLKPQTENQFDFSSKKDPFKPYTLNKPLNDKDPRGRITKPVLPIHSYDVTQFRLIGVITDSRGNKAMVVDPNGKGYVLQQGMTIGKNEGKISQIYNNGFDVVEQFRDDNGKIRKETINVFLPKKQ